MIDGLPSLAPLLEAASDPAAATARLVASGARVLGLQCANLPAELPHALGLHPLRLMLRPEPATRAPALYQTFACSWAQALLDQALAGHLAGLVGVSFGCNTCDSIQNLPAIWRDRVQAPAAIASLRFPALGEGEAARELLAFELERWGRWLASLAAREAVAAPRREERSGPWLDRARLADSARLFNRIRAALRGLHGLAREERLPYSLLQAASLGSELLPRAYAAELLEAALREAGADRREPRATRARVALVGGVLDDLRLLRFLEERGVQCVLDDTCALGRSFEPAMDLDPEDALADLAARHLRRSPCPVVSGSGPRRSAAIVAAIHEQRVGGVILIPYRGCEPHGFDNVLIGRALKAEGVPQLLIEIDPHWGGPSWGTIANRLEAFLEMISGVTDDLY
jgi:benzoyl-CoA reductase/2-hydroxyglutaryl-CoA dehydratase subunit BcrC/BadD/HgdB